MIEPSLKPGDVFWSPGCNYQYRVIGACCLLYDREQLPYPSCSLQWKGKEPSWRRIGKRFIPDISSKYRECYAVKLINYPSNDVKFWVFTYWSMPENLKSWWYSLRKGEIPVD